MEETHSKHAQNRLLGLALSAVCARRVYPLMVTQCCSLCVSIRVCKCMCVLIPDKLFLNLLSVTNDLVWNIAVYSAALWGSHDMRPFQRRGWEGWQGQRKNRTSDRGITHIFVSSTIKMLAANPDGLEMKFNSFGNTEIQPAKNSICCHLPFLFLQLIG